MKNGEDKNDNTNWDEALEEEIDKARKDGKSEAWIRQNLDI